MSEIKNTIKGIKKLGDKILENNRFYEERNQQSTIEEISS